MEITKSLQDDIVKIQHELITAIQNHQVLVWRQQGNRTEIIKKQIEEVQRHIICLGESQKILVSRLRNEIQPKASRFKNNNNKTASLQCKISKCEKEEQDKLKGVKDQEFNRSVLANSINQKELKERSLLKQSFVTNNESAQKNLPLKEQHASIDSSSEENRTPCCSPVTRNKESESGGCKRSLPEVSNQVSQTKRPKTTLQATPRPSSPTVTRPKDSETTSSLSDESMDSISQQPESNTSKIDFALTLGLVTKEFSERVMKKRCERKRRKNSSVNNLYNGDWELTVLQKRSRLKRAKPQEVEVEDESRDCSTPQSDNDGLCFACLKPGELQECRVCHTGCHPSCVANNICPACLQRPCNPLTAGPNRLCKSDVRQGRPIASVHKKS